MVLMIYVTPEQMRRIETASDYAALPYPELLDNAAAEVTRLISMISSDVNASGGIVVLCGHGNNAADGYTIAKNLVDSGKRTFAVLVDGEPKSGLAIERHNALKKSGKAGIIRFDKDMDAAFAHASEAAIIVDAVYGIGFQGDMMPPTVMECFNFIRRCRAVKIAVDIPSGGNALTGEVSHKTLKFDYTVTFGYKKTGMLMRPLRDYCGEIIVADIGLTEELNAGIDYLAEDVAEDYILSVLPPRKNYSQKGSYGKLLTVAGCSSMSGAAALSTLAALRCGVGLTRLASTKTVVDRLAGSILEATYLPLSEDKTGAIDEESVGDILLAGESATAVSAGSGLSVTDGTTAIISKLVKKTECPLILDADGITCLAENLSAVKSARNRIVITPNAAELATLAYKAGIDVKSRYTAAVELSKNLGVIVVAKGMPTFIVGANIMGEGVVRVCHAGNAGLSKGGSGDVLTGIIGAFTAQGVEPFDAAVAGVYIHG
jgi:NAD(P)H-hydrate epimerase